MASASTCATVESEFDSIVTHLSESAPIGHEWTSEPSDSFLALNTKNPKSYEGKPRNCFHQIQRATSGSGWKQVAVPCGLRRCEDCRGRMDTKRFRELMPVFVQLAHQQGKDVYTATVSRKLATQASQYAHKTGNPAVTIPAPDGLVTVFTTVKRKDWFRCPAREVEDFLHDALKYALYTAPANEAGAERQVRIGYNTTLTELIHQNESDKKRESVVTDDEKAQKVLDRKKNDFKVARSEIPDARRYYGSPGFDEMLLRLGLATVVSNGGVREFREATVEADGQAVFDEFWAAMGRRRMVNNPKHLAEARRQGA